MSRSPIPSLIPVIALAAAMLPWAGMAVEPAHRDTYGQQTLGDHEFSRDDIRALCEWRSRRGMPLNINCQEALRRPTGQDHTPLATERGRYQAIVDLSRDWLYPNGASFVNTAEDWTMARVDSEWAIYTYAGPRLDESLEDFVAVRRSTLRQTPAYGEQITEQTRYLGFVRSEQQTDTDGRSIKVRRYDALPDLE